MYVIRCVLCYIVEDRIQCKLYVVYCTIYITEDRIPYTGGCISSPPLSGVLMSILCICHFL